MFRYESKVMEKENKLSIPGGGAPKQVTKSDVKFKLCSMFAA